MVQWMFHTAVESEWKAINVQRVPRSVIPQSLIAQGMQFGWHVKDMSGQSILFASVKAGVFLILENIKLLCARMDVELPERGSGKKHNLIKVDYAAALVKKMFPDDDPEEQKRMTACLTWPKSKNLADDDRQILDYVAQLDEENRECPEFKRVAKFAKERLKKDERLHMEREVRKKVRDEQEEHEKRLREAEAAAVNPREGRPDAEPGDRDAAAAASSRKPGTTPPELKDLLDTKIISSDHRISITRDPTSYGYRAFYPGSSFLSNSKCLFFAICLLDLPVLIV